MGGFSKINELFRETTSAREEGEKRPKKGVWQMGENKQRISRCPVVVDTGFFGAAAILRHQLKETNGAETQQSQKKDW